MPATPASPSICLSARSLRGCEVLTGGPTSLVSIRPIREIRPARVSPGRDAARANARHIVVRDLCAWAVRTNA
jgi:hypothetical protein